MSQVMDHIRELSSVIGPRPATTDAEARAAEYIEGVFKTYGLDPERQEFDCPRTRSWAFVIYNVLTIGAAVLSLKWGVPALVIAVLAAVMYRLDMQMHFSISRFLPKGPSQNVIARHVPHMRRGDRLQRVVIVAHYDSPKASLMASPSVAKRANMLSTIAWWATVLTPIVILVGIMPFASGWTPWTGYAALAAAVYLLVPLIMHLYSEFFLPATEGANDNASGVAALLGVVQALVPAGDQGGTVRMPPVRRSVEVAREADVVIEDALLEYRSVDAKSARKYDAPVLDGFDDVSWETGSINVSSVVTPRPVVPRTDDEQPYGDRTSGDRAYGEPMFSTPVFGGEDEESDTGWAESPVNEGQERFALPSEEPDSAHRESAEYEPRSARHSTSRGRSRGRGRADDAGDSDVLETPQDPQGVSDWLGIGRGFDVRKAGKKMGSWDNIDDDDEFGLKGGMAGGRFDTDSHNFDSASQIRMRVTEGVDRALSEKEIWFVATGAAGAGACGMRALLREYAEELRDALIIVIDGVGSGSVSFVTREGIARDYQADRRLIAQAKRTARENTLPITAKTTRGVLTDTLPALAGRFKAMGVMAFDINGRLPDRQWTSDTVESISEATVEQAATFVTELVRDL